MRLYQYVIVLTTALSQMRAILSSTPLTPSGIWVKSSLPMAFWATLKVQWALPVTLRSPLGGEEAYWRYYTRTVKSVYNIKVL